MNNFNMNTAPYDNTEDVDALNRVINHRNASKTILSSRLQELLPQLIEYDNLPPSLSKIQIETHLRIYNHNLIIGEDIKGDIIILGQALTIKRNYYNYPIVQTIRFFVPREMRKKSIEYKQITPQDLTGNYVLLMNRYDENYVGDVNIIDYYTDILAELSATRYSLSAQAKMVTFFKGNDIENNNRLNHTVWGYGNAIPFVEVSSQMTMKDMIENVGATGQIPNLMVATKNEWNNRFNEMLNFIGVPNLGIDKASGVNDYEAKSNQALYQAVGNITINARKDAFLLINEKYGLNVIPRADSNVISETVGLAEPIPDMDNHNSGGVNNNDE